MQIKKENQPSKIWFFALFSYLFIDLGRLQDLIPIGFLKPGVLTNGILFIFLIASGRVFGQGSKQLNYIVLFVLLLGAHIPFAQNSYLAYKTTLAMILFLPCIFSIVIVVNTLSKFKTFINFNILLMVYICLYSLSHKGQGSGGYFTDENDLCLYVITILPFCYYLFIHTKKIIVKLFYGISILIAMMSVVTSSSRGGFLGFLAMAGVIWLYSKKKTITLVLCSILGCIVFLFYADDSYRSEMGTIQEYNEGTSMGRLMSWKAGWDMFLDNPLGVGGNNFQIRFPEYQSEWFKRSMWGRVAHSLWFTLIPELGILGVYIFIKLIIFNFKDLRFVKRITQTSGSDTNLGYLYLISLSCIASFCGFFIGSSFISVLYYPFFWYMTALVVALTNVCNTELSYSNRMVTN